MPIKQIVLISLLAGLFLNQGDTYSLSARSYNHPDERAAVVDQIKVELKLLKGRPGELEMEVMIKNTGTQDVYVMTDPVRVDSSKGPYISISDETSGAIDVEVKVFPLPKYFLLTNDARVKLEKLAAGATLKEVFHLTSLVSETMPPYGETPRPRKIEPDRLQFVRASVGVLPDDEGVRDLLRRKPFGPWVSGVEELMQGPFKGKRILDLQRVYTSATVRKE